MEAAHITIRVPADGMELPGNLILPPNPRGVILFGHGAGSGRFSLRNRFVAGTLNACGFATLLVDLLTHDENDSPSARTDLRLVISRLAAVTRSAIADDRLRDLPFGFVGSRIGAPASLWCAAQFACRVKAVVVRGGKADLAREALPNVHCPVLLLAGEKDAPVVESSGNAYRLLENAKKRRFSVIPGASHLFEEQGALETVALLTRDWFLTHLAGGIRSVSVQSVSVRPKSALEA